MEVRGLILGGSRFNLAPDEHFSLLAANVEKIPQAERVQLEEAKFDGNCLL